MSQKKPTVDELRDAYKDLHDNLRDAFRKATEEKDQNYFLRLKEDVSDILTNLNKAQFESHTPEFQNLSKSVKAVNAKLDTLKGEIDKIIGIVEITAKITSAIEKVITLATKYFA